MSVRAPAVLVLAALDLLALTACVDDQTGNAMSGITRAEVQARTGDVQRRIIDAFPSESLAGTRTGGWTLLSCSENEVQSVIGADLILAESVPVDATYGVIMRDLESDGDRTERGATSHGPRLVVTGRANDQYFVSILNDSKPVQVSSFSQCFRGSLTDG